MPHRTAPRKPSPLANPAFRAAVTILGRSPAFYFATDFAGTVLHANRAAAAAWRATPRTMRGRSLLSWLRPADAEAVARRLRELEGGADDEIASCDVVLDLPARSTLAASGIAWLAVGRRGARLGVHWLFARRDAVGRLAAFGEVARDLVARRPVEGALRRSEEQYRRLFDDNPNPMIVFDRDNLFILGANQAAIRRYGYSRADLLGMTIQQIFAGARAPSSLVSPSGAPSPTPLPARQRTKDGTTIDVEVSFFDAPFESRRARLVLSNDVTAERRAREAFAASREQLRSLAARLQDIREEERARLARQIHDELAQNLTALKLDLWWLGKKLPAGARELRDKACSMTALLDSTIHSVRRISTELRPGVLDDLGLAAAIEWQTREFQAQTGIPCSFHSLLVEPEVDRERSTALFRILQEALANIVCHSSANQVAVSLQDSGNRLVLEVRDDGCGIDDDAVQAPMSLGLAGMRERARLLGGDVDVVGHKGRGTTVTAAIPLPH